MYVISLLVNRSATAIERMNDNLFPLLLVYKYGI